MMPDSWLDWLTGGIATTILAVIGLWWKIRHEREQTRTEAKDVAMTAAESAVKVVQQAMTTQGTQMEDMRRVMTEQSTRLADQDERITDLTKRVTTIDQSHQVALRHIAEREGFAIRHWPKRPQDLPAIPALIIADVVAVDPSLDKLRRAGHRPRDSDEEVEDPAEE